MTINCIRLNRTPVSPAPVSLKQQDGARPTEVTKLICFLNAQEKA